MSNKFLIIVILILASLLGANPSAPQVMISEVFPNNSTTKLELRLVGAYNYDDFDSVVISTNSSRAYLNLTQPPSQSNSYHYLVSNSMLSKPLIFNPDGDNLRIVTYASWDYGYSYNLADSLSWGLGTELENIKNNQSIANIRYTPYNGDMAHRNIGSKDNSPTPAASNATFTGTLQGYLRDSTNIPIPNKTVYLGRLWSIDNNIPNHDLFMAIQSDQNGHFSTAAYARKYNCAKVFDFSFIASVPITIIPDSFYVEPDSVTTHDIVLTGYNGIGADYPVKPEVISIFNYPNPGNPGTTICYSLPETAELQKLKIIVTNIKGEEVAAYHLNTRDGSVMFEAAGRTAGMYNYRLMQGNSLLKSGSMVIVK